MRLPTEPTPTAERLLGLDVGARRIGVAVSQGGIAVPLKIIEHTNRAADIALITALAAEHDVRTIVVGVPLDASGGETEQSRLNRKFADDLAARADLTVICRDESYSTVQVADARARPKKRGSRHVKARVDDLAAAAILQAHLDERGAAL